MKRLISLILTLACLLCAIPVTVVQAAATYCYDPDAAIAYAEKNWNVDPDTVLCDQFVKNCLDAGGVAMLAGGVDPLLEALVDASFGESSEIQVAENGRSITHADNPKLKKGDVLFYYCKKCERHIHTVIIGGFDENGNAFCYGHHPGWNKVDWFGTFKHSIEGGGYHENCTTFTAVHMDTEPRTHKHDFYTEKDGLSLYDTAHPHNMYAQCDCGAKYYLGWNATVKSCTTCNPPLDTKPIVTAKIAQKDSKNVVTLSWSTVEGAIGYLVYRAKSANGTYYALTGSPLNATTYVNSSVEEGSVYYYRVDAVKADDEAVPSAVVSIQVPAAETLAVPAKPYNIVNVVSGIHVYWKTTEGADKYGLWRSEDGKNGTYQWIANPTVPHFTDTKVESGKTYWYKVTSLDTDTNTHSEKSEAIGLTYVATPDITLRVNRAVGIGLRWDKITGATGYAIYRKSYDGGDAWVRIATIEGGDTLSWDDTTVKNNNGEVYRYTIRALAGSNMKTLSGCRNTGRTMVRITSLTLNSATKASANSIKCSWSKNEAVTGYEVRFMVGSIVYKTFTIGNINTTTKTFTGLPTGQTYKIQVRSYKRVDGVGSFYSAWSTAKNVTL